MKLNHTLSLFVRGTVLLVALAFATAITGCGIGAIQADNSTDTVAPAIKGVLHGGPTPVVGARVVIYATTSTGYGTGAVLQEATQVGSSHQDTSSTGAFTFAGGFTCPAGQYVYIVAYGGNTGGNTNNPNSVLMSALGSCSSLYSGTTYSGGNLIINELTTVAAAYALSNFISVTGNAVSGYTVGVGTDTTNSASTGCVANAYYSSCSATTTAGLAHAFATAGHLVNANSGTASTTTTTGAIIPTPEINSIGNIMQSCVNSNGGGTDGSSGLPTAVIGSSGTSSDGTTCGKFFAFTSYTSNGLQTGGTAVYAGNTLSAAQNMAKHPTGTPSTFNSSCASNSTGTTTAATCLYNLAAANGFYNSAMTAAPPDWSLSIQWPKASFSNASNATACSGSTPATNGLLYPFMLATDINDNLVILNGDASTNVCMNLLTIGYDGTPLGANAFDSTGALLSGLAVDSFGHAIVPVHGTGGTANANNGVRIYQAGTADSAIPLITTYEQATSVAANLPYYVGVDQRDTIWIAAQNAATDMGWLALSGANSHATPTYTGGGTSTAVTSSMVSASIDVNGNVFSVNTSSSGTERVRVIASQIPSASTNAVEAVTGTAPASPTDTTSNGEFVVPDLAGNAWTITTGPASTTATQGNGAEDVVWSTAYTTSSGAFSSFASTSTEYTGSTTSQFDYSIKAGAIDGSGVVWWGDLQGSTSASAPAIDAAYIHGFDTINKIYLPMINGCAFNAAGTFTITGWSITSAGTTFTVTSNSTPTNTNSPSVGSTITLSGFGASTFFNGQSVTVSATSATTAPFTFTTTNTFGQATTSSTTETGTASGTGSNQCGSNSGDYNFPSQTYPFYGTRGVAIDSAGNVWAANGTQGRITEMIGVAAPTWPLFIHNGTSNKP